MGERCNYDMSKIYEYYLKYRVVFIIEFFLGIVIHFYILANLLYNHDSAVLSSNNFDWLLVQGKWFVTPLASLDGFLDLSYISQIICLLSVSIASIVIAEMYKLESSRSIVLIGLIFISFPSIATMAVYHDYEIGRASCRERV